jgi:4a-hydroxytetrahydrobiopterin dehydratase
MVPYFMQASPILKSRPSYNNDMRLPKLTPEEIDDALKTLNNWQATEGKLHRDYKFPDFIHAFGFMATAAIAIEKMNHHPEWSNVYNRVAIDVTTHDSGVITNNDIELAHLLEGIAAKLL